MDEKGAMQLQDLQAGTSEVVPEGCSPEQELQQPRQQQQQQPPNGSIPGSGRDQGQGSDWQSQVTKESTLSVRPRRLQVPPFPRRTDFGEHYPDGGWGWVVCGAAFVVRFLSHGLHLASGSLFLQIVSKFEAEENAIVWLCSASMASSCLMFPVVTAICRQKSPRLSAVVGGLITALGCLFMSFSTKVHQLLISSILVLGVGTGITVSTASVIVGRYFQRRRECAEMLTLSGSGVGMALMSVFIKQVMSLADSWMRSMQAMTGLLLCTVIAGALYRSPSLYHPRRRAILHLQSLRKTKKQQHDFENKLPYLDFSPLRMRGLQVLMVATATITLGTFVPFVLLPGQARDEQISDTSILLLMVFMGVAFAFGCLLVGLVVIRSSLRCMVARRYLCQITAAGCGLVSMLFTMASGFKALALFVWMFGLLVGGFTYSLKVYTYELVSLKLSERSWGYVMMAQALPILLGTPIAFYLNQSSDTGRAGFLFSGISMVTGSVLLFFMPWASRHPSNHRVIQTAHLMTKTFDEDLLFLGMEVSDNMSSNQQRDPDGSPYACAQRRLRMSKMRTFYQNGSAIYEEEAAAAGGWSEIEAMSPMSPTDKVTEFLVHSQSMLQNYSQLHHLDLPSVRLEINNEYPPSDVAGDVISRDEITDLKLEATIYRNSFKGTPRKNSEVAPPSASDPVSDVEAEPQVPDDRADDFTEKATSVSLPVGRIEKQTAV